MKVKFGKYYKAFNFRALAVGLQYENEQLHQLLSQLTGTTLRESVQLNPSQEEQHLVNESARDIEESVTRTETSTDSVTDRRGKKKCRGKKKKTSTGLEEGTNDEELEAYLKFAMETEKHRRERDSNLEAGDRRNVDVDSEEEHKVNEGNIIVDYERLKKEMSELYGTNALKIHCQETRTELAFTEWRDKHKPVTWPSLPLNIFRN